jgi:hypothetical protein
VNVDHFFKWEGAVKRLFLLVAVLLMVAPAVNAQYAFEPVVCPGVTVPALTAVNNHGTMVGAYYTDNDPFWHAFIIEDGECRPLGPETVLASYWSLAVGLNDRGDVVGAYMDENWTRHGFLLDKRGVLTTIDFSEAGGTWLCGINESGVIVGYGLYSDSTRGFTWTDGVFSKIAIGSFDDYIGGINARGDFVGEADGQLLVCVKGTCTIVGDLVAGAVYVQGNGINAKGDATASFYDAANVQHGLLLKGSSVSPLDFPGKTATAPIGINNAGVIVGVYFEGAIQLGFVARPMKK